MPSRVVDMPCRVGPCQPGWDTNCQHGFQQRDSRIASGSFGTRNQHRIVVLLRQRLAHIRIDSYLANPMSPSISQTMNESLAADLCGRLTWLAVGTTIIPVARKALLRRQQNTTPLRSSPEGKEDE
jgi:hypothetical protein